MDYFISDLHFGHKAILKMGRKDFKTIEEHDAFIMASINKKVKMTDTLYILGDIGDLEKVRELNGRKILITGNHDKRSLKEYNGYFAEVHEEWFPYSKRIILSHYPRQVEANELNIHGHLHRSFLDSYQHKNVCCDVIDYVPITTQHLTTFLQQVPKKLNNKFLEEWFADKYTFMDLERKDVLFDEKGKVKLPETIEHRKTFFKEPPCE